MIATLGKPATGIMVKLSEWMGSGSVHQVAAPCNEAQSDVCLPDLLLIDRVIRMWNINEIETQNITLWIFNQKI